MEKTFYFIDGIQADRTSKKLMRRHVMKGKNAGKTFHRPSRLAMQSQQPDAVNDIKLARTRYGRDEESRQMLQMPLTAGLTTLRFADALFTLSLPAEVAGYALEIINRFLSHVEKRMYPVRLDLPMNEIRAIWVRTMFLDADAYQCSIFLMQAGIEIFEDNGKSSPAALYRISQTLAAVARRLQSNDALSNSTIAIIISLVHQEQMRRQQAAAQIHFKGLARIVELRGGPGKLRAGGDSFLFLKICKTDVMLALQYGGRTLFFEDRMPEVREILATKGLHLDDNSAASLSLEGPVNTDLETALSDAMAILPLFSKGLPAGMFGYLIYLDIIISTFYRLLRQSPLDEPPPQSTTHAMYHIGLLIFTMTTLVRRGPSQIIKFGLIFQRLRTVLENGLGECDDELAFWVTFMGGIWVADDIYDDWFAQRVRVLSRRLGFDSWQLARSSLHKFPWIDDLHEHPSRELWDRITQAR